MDLRQELITRFGFKEFRGDQERVIQASLNGQHSLVLMPTGMGKSLCYQLPSVLNSGLTLVISPLIALMEDQLLKAKQRGIRAGVIHSNLSQQERAQAYQGLSKNKFQLMFVTPERFRKPEFIDAIQSQKVSLLAIDEAHCISEWGHDFRPDYTRIAEFRSLIGNPTTMALTATATPEVQLDIIKQIGLSQSEVQVFRSGIERPNLNIQVEDVHGIDQKIQAIVALRHQVPGAGIVYFSLIQTLEKVSRELSRLGIDHLVYHGQMKASHRKAQQREFITSKDPLILATPAFGLGVDKPDVRLVMHGEIPGSIESYYQEIGRAGRDGQAAQCICLLDEDDVSIQMDFIKWSHPEPSFIRSVYGLIRNRQDQVNSQGLDFIREQLNFYNRRDFRVETAVNLLERWGSIEITQHGRHFAALEEPEGEWLDQDHWQSRIRKQQEKLLMLLQLLQQSEGYLPKIYTYFGVYEQ